jgi:hypothetical protein
MRRRTKDAHLPIWGPVEPARRVYFLARLFPAPKCYGVGVDKLLSQSETQVVCFIARFYFYHCIISTERLLACFMAHFRHDCLLVSVTMFQMKTTQPGWEQRK